MVFPNMTSKKDTLHRILLFCHEIYDKDDRKIRFFAENQYRMELAVEKSTRINPGTNTNMALMAPGH
ncbi:MAG: hypothetical protein WB511_06120 [Nitrososphaeraceae archaeon]